MDKIPILDTRDDDVQLENGTYDVHCANTIADNLWSQCDSEGMEIQQFREIIDHKKDGPTITIDNGYKIMNGHKKSKKTTARWKLLVKFADGSTSWLLSRR